MGSLAKSDIRGGQMPKVTLERLDAKSDIRGGQMTKVTLEGVIGQK